VSHQTVLKKKQFKRQCWAIAGDRQKDVSENSGFMTSQNRQS